MAVPGEKPMAVDMLPPGRGLDMPHGVKLGLWDVDSGGTGHVTRPAASGAAAPPRGGCDAGLGTPLVPPARRPAPQTGRLSTARSKRQAGPQANPYRHGARQMLRNQGKLRRGRCQLPPDASTSRWCVEPVRDRAPALAPGHLPRRNQRLDDLPQLVADLEHLRHPHPSVALCQPNLEFAVDRPKPFVQRAL